jgi:hypothetical protein
MVSAQLAGVYRVYVENPSGARQLIKSAPNYWWGPGGSSDGTIANTPEKWNYLPLSGVRCGPGYKIVVTYEGAAGTTDASDAVWIVPVSVNGSQQTVGNSAAAGGLGNNNFTVDLTFGDIAIVANVETPLSVMRAKEGVYFSVGGDRVWLTVENNA